MYGTIMVNGENREKFAKELKVVDCLSDRVGVSRADSEMACSEMIGCRDFVVIKADDNEIIEKIVLKFSFSAACVGKVNISDCGGDYAIVFKGHCKDMFGDDFFNKEYTRNAFLYKLNEVMEKQAATVNVNKVIDFFTKVGLYANLSGYNLLLSAVKYSLNSPEMLLEITTRLYPKIAETYHMTVQAVERNIRNAIAVAFVKGKIYDVANRCYGANFSVNDKPTNSEFIAFLTTIAKR